jgi:acyl-CoA dehydrogenase
VLGELRPHAPEWEAARSFPRAVFERCAQEGWLGLKYPERYGGSDLGYVADAVWIEELSRCGSGGLAAGIGAHVGIATPPVWKFGSEEQKQRWLAPAIRGEKIGALAITEPDAGSDVASIRTHARRVDGGWLVDGSKTFITNGVRADFYVTAVKTRAEGGHHGLSFLVIERGDGVSARPLEKLGWHASDTAELAFADVYVPDEHRLGDEGRGFHLIMANFQWERSGRCGRRSSACSSSRVSARSARQCGMRSPSRRCVRRPGPRSPTTRCAASSTAATRCAR